MSAPRWEAVFDAIVTHGPELFVGVTIVLAGGLLCARAQRTAAARRRLGIWSAAASGLYLAIAALPLPRLGPTAMTPEDLPGAAAPAGVLPVGATRAEVIEALGLLDEPTVLPREPAAPATVVDRAPARVMPLATGPAVDWSRAIAMVYLASAALLLLHHLLGMLRLRSIVRRARPAATATRRLADLPPATRLVIAHRPVRPFCAGWLRPIVVLSPDLEDRPELLAAVLRHEAAHLRARDPLVQTLFALLALPLALHPLFWWLRADVRFQSELLADESAAGTDPTDYARELLDLVDRPAPLVTAAGTVAVFHRPSAFYRRIHMLLQPVKPSSRPLSRIRRAGQCAAMLALVATTAGVFGVPVAAQDPARSRQEALEAERQALRAEIELLRAQIAELRTHVRRDAAAAPQPLAGMAVPPATVDWQPTPLVWGRIDPTTGEFTPLPPPETTPPDPVRAAPANPPGLPSAAAPALPGSAAPEPVEPAGVPFLRDVPTLDKLYGQPPGASGRLPAASDWPAPAAPTARGIAATAEGTVELTSRLLDLETEIEIAQSEFQESQALAESAMISKGEIRRAEARLHNLIRKRDIVRGLVDGEIKATETEIAWLSQKLRRADRNGRLQWEMQIQRAEGRLQALRAAR